jgi:hypothetical protein
MALFTYIRRCQRLLRDQRMQLINPADLIDYINEARQMMAGEAECLRVIGTLALTAGVNVYPFSAIGLGGAAGIEGVLNVRAAWYQVATGQKWLTPRSFEWFSLYELNNPVPTPGPPYAWAQYGQGTSGTLYFGAVPDGAYTIPLDCVCYPVPLADDTTAEAIPLLWTFAIPYYATYLAMLSMETGGATAEADRMMKRYAEMVMRARAGVTPSVLPGNYAQSETPPPRAPQQAAS